MASHPTDRAKKSAAAGPDHDSDRSGPSPMLLLGAGLEFAAAVGGLALLGWWLDGRWQTAPWLMLMGLFLGLVGETYKLWKISKRFFK